MQELIRDRYEPLAVVGRGGQGQVVRALDRVHDRLVAMKVRTVPDDASREAILSEARILLTLRPHELVTLVREDFFEGDRYFLVMDWVDGRTLHEVIHERDGAVPLEEALGYLSDVAEALAHLHAHDPPIVHKDVKPANIIITPAGRAVLVDFGIAAGGGDAGRGSAGTRGYVAPELMSGGAATPAADVFGLAATAFAVFTGSPPRAGRRPRWRGIPKERAQLVDRALTRGLAFDPARRQASAPELVASMRSDAAVPGNVPLQLTSFIGRDALIDEVVRALDRARLVTLTGPGGIGKTRLALAAASEPVVQRPDGVWFVELAAVTDPSRVVQAVASALGVRESAGGTLRDGVVAFLLARDALLIIDNCEHLVSACAELVRAILGTCPNVRILATSRESLGVPGETVLRVPPMSVPDGAGLPVDDVASAESVALFVERAQLVQPAFALREDNAAVVARLCRQLDGIPLAVELAAARVSTMSVAEIESRLGHRFQLLSARKGAADPRQHSLRAVVDWSYDLLEPAERDLLQVLSVFSGGFTLGRAELVAGVDPADDLAQLVDKSLVMLDDASDPPRFGMLETIREYAEERLHESGRDDEIRARHCDAFEVLALQAEGALEGPEQTAWLDALEKEHGNIRAALAWSLADPTAAERTLRTAAALWRFWDMRGYLSEGRSWLAQALERAEGTSAEARAKALRGAGGLALDQGDYETARELDERSVALAREAGARATEASALNSLAIGAGAQSDFERERELYLEALAIWRELGHRRGIAVTLGNLGTASFEQGDKEAARAYLEESLAIRRELGDRQGLAQALNGLALVAGALGEEESERALFAESLEIWREIGYRRGVAVALLNLGTAALGRGRREEARELLDESAGILRELGVKWDLAECLHALGDLAFAEGDLDLAGARYEESLRIRTELRDRRGCAECIEALAGLAAARGGYEACVCAIAAAETIRSSIGAGRAGARALAVERDLDAARRELGSAAYDAAWGRGGALTFEEAAATALAGAGLNPR